MNYILSILMKFCTVDNLCTLIAKAISAILLWASKKGGDKWEKAKGIIKKVKLWCELFDKVYDDDAMSKEEEKLVADAIKREVPVEKLVEILNGKK